MKLYVVRHAIAEKRGAKFFVNDDRPLTKTGVRKMQKNAVGIATIVTTPLFIISSPLKRAFSTAEILASRLSKSTSITLSDDLLPESPVENILQLCKTFKENEQIMIVGHEPSLGRFLSVLLRQKEQSLNLKKGSLCCVEFDMLQPRTSTLLFYIPPAILRMLSR